MNWLTKASDKAKADKQKKRNEQDLKIILAISRNQLWIMTVTNSSVNTDTEFQWAGYSSLSSAAYVFSPAINQSDRQPHLFRRVRALKKSYTQTASYFMPPVPIG